MANSNVAVPIADLKQLIADAQKRWLTIQQATEYSGLGDRTLRKLLGDGRLTKHNPVAGRIVIDRHQLDAYIRSTASQ